MAETPETDTNENATSTESSNIEPKPAESAAAESASEETPKDASSPKTEAQNEPKAKPSSKPSDSSPSDSSKKKPSKTKSKNEGIRLAHTSVAAKKKTRRDALIFAGSLVVLVLIVIAFVFLPALVPGMVAQTDTTFGAYHKRKIEAKPGSFFVQTLTNLNQQYPQFAGNEFFVQMLWRAAFDETVVHEGILEEMDKARYSVPPSVVDQRIAGNNYLLTLYRREPTETDKMNFWNQLRDTLIEERYRSDLDAAPVSSETTFLGRMAVRQRSFQAVALSFDTFPDDEVAAFAASKPELFKTIRLSRITMSSERDAKEVRTQVQSGTTSFADAATTHSQDAYADQGGDMGQKLSSDLAVEIPDEKDRTAILALGAGELSNVVAVPTGWAFFRVEEPARTADFTAGSGAQPLLEKVRNYLRDFERGRIEDYLLADAGRLRDRISEIGFDAALAERELPADPFGPVAVNYGDSDLLPRLSSFGVAYFQDSIMGYEAWNDDVFWKTAFGTKLLSPSVPLVMGSNIVILYPTEELAAPVEEIENAYIAGVNEYTDQSIRSFFTRNPLVTDNFDATYQRLRGGQSQY